MYRPQATWALVVSALSLSAGCGRKDFPVAPVSGVVTLNGKPLSNARIGFEPVAAEGKLLAGPGAYGKTDEQGRYHLETIDGDRGAVVGMNRVWVRTAVSKADGNAPVSAVTPEKLPAKFHAQSELTLEVPKEGTAKADFELTTK